MTHSDEESVLSSALTTSFNPFSIAARSTGSSAILQNTRHKHDRRPVVPIIQKKTSVSHLRPPTRLADESSPLQEISTMAGRRTDEDFLADELEMEEAAEQGLNQETFMDQDINLGTPGPGSSVSQSSGNSSKRQRVPTSDIWTQATMEQ